MYLTAFNSWCMKRRTSCRINEIHILKCCAAKGLTYAVCQSLLALDQLEERLRLAQLHQEVHVVFVFKGIVQVYNMGMLEFHVNFDFTFEFRFVPGLF